MEQIRNTAENKKPLGVLRSIGERATQLFMTSRRPFMLDSLPEPEVRDDRPHYRGTVSIGAAPIDRERTYGAAQAITRRRYKNDRRSV